MMDLFAVFTPLLGHVAGVPVEETLPGVLAVGAVGARLAAEWVRRRFPWRSAREKDARDGGHTG
ncbi:MAG TPA: hypothetical protein VIZ61_03010 [Solirubrobacterales bacterium]